MNKILLAWTIIFIIIGGGILLYGMSFNPLAWFNGYVTFTEPNDEPIPWGLLVIGYMFFGVIGTGVSTYNTLYEIFNLKHKENNPFEKISLRNEWLAFAVLIPGFIMVFASAYKPAEAMYIYLTFRDTSRIAWNGVLYVLVGIGIIAEILALIGTKVENKQSAGGKFLSWLASIITLIAFYVVLVELILDANLGAVFGYLSTWVDEFGAFMPVLFVILSFYGGIAAISFSSVIYGKLVKVKEHTDPHNSMYKTLARDGLLSSIAIGFLMLWWMWITATNQETRPWADILLSGTYSTPFWVGVVLIGIILPILLYAVAYKTGNTKVLFVTSILVAIGMFAIITLVDIIPQSITWYYTISPISPTNSNWVFELRSIFNNAPLWNLLPFKISFYDIVWFVGSVLFLLGFYTLGVLLLPLEEEEKPRHFFFK